MKMKKKTYNFFSDASDAVSDAGITGITEKIISLFSRQNFFLTFLFQMQTKNKTKFFLMKMKKKTYNFFSDASDAAVMPPVMPKKTLSKMLDFSVMPVMPLSF
jgi:hypothetical protein